MDEVITLKAQMYDLMAQRQAIEQVMGNINKRIVELSQKQKEEKKAE